MLLDFWADWCGPCKAFAPVLERLAAEYGGAFLLGKVDTEVELELSHAFGVQSIPFVVLVQAGRPVDAFAGALPEAEMRALLTRFGIQPKAAAPAEPALEPSDVAAIREARDAVRAGETERARGLLESIPEDSERAVDRDNLAIGLDLLDAELDASHPAGAQLTAARDAFLAGRFAEAMQAIVASARIDRSYADGLARRAMRLCQGLLGDAEEVEEYRRQLATALY